MTKKGILYLIPIPIAEGKLDTILPSTVTIIHNLKYFVAENARTARRFISSTRPPYALQDVDVKELNKHDAADINTLLAPLSSGHNVGVMSEAGCPGVADPGALLVEWAHKKEIKVLLDFVSNHVHTEHPYFKEHRDWFGQLELPDGRLNLRFWDEFRLTTWFEPYLASFDYLGSEEALEEMTDIAVWWLNETGADGYRQTDHPASNG